MKSIKIPSRTREREEFLGNSCSSWEDWGAGLCCGEEMVIMLSYSLPTISSKVMGEWLEPVFPSSSTSSYFLDVGEEEPFARGQEGLANCGR